MYANDNWSDRSAQHSLAAPPPNRGEQINIPPVVVTGDHTMWPGTDCRIRLRNGLKNFDPSLPAFHLFPSQEAFIDRFQMTMEFAGRCNPDDFAEIRETLLDWEGPYPGRGRLLQEKGRSSTRHVPLEIASGSWLFGSVPVKGSSLISFRGADRFELRLTLSLNLNRFLAHHAGRSLDDIENLHPCHALRLDPGMRPPAGLDGNDNLIPASTLRLISVPQREAFIERALHIYCNHVRRLFQIELDTIGEGLETRRPLSFAAVQQAEVSWDLLDPDPLTRIVEIERVAEGVCSDLTTAGRYGRGIRGDARWLAIPLTNEVQLKVYAKTSDRLRFEVCFGRIRQEARRQGVGSGSPIADLLAMRENASSRMFRFWRSVAPRLLERPREADLMEFLHRLQGARLEENRRIILSMLAWNGGMTPAAAPQHVIQRLVRVGILHAAASVRHGGVKKFPLRAEWRRCLDRYLSDG